MRKTALRTFILTACLLFLSTSADAWFGLAPKKAKHVFLFLGDGMGAAQIQAAEAWLTIANGGDANDPAAMRDPQNRLNMCKMPVHGLQTTFSDGSLITDSAAAGTAFTCGVKTRGGVINMNPDATIAYKSVARLAHENGMSVGVVSSVSLDHATPAACYASVPSRNHMNNICNQLAASGYEFFGGGGLKSPTAPCQPGDTGDNAWDALARNGYTVLNDRDSILALGQSPIKRVVCVNPWLQDAAAMPYAIDRPPTNVSLAEMTETAINCLKHDRDGFFILVEGGKIDWACHANDARTVIGDVLAFDAAVKRAVDFYNAHPKNTLIIVTGDHETGGMSVGNAVAGYSENLAALTAQRHSLVHFLANHWPKHKQTYAGAYDWEKDNLNSDDPDAAAFVALLNDCFGLEWAALDERQQTLIENAYDKSMTGFNRSGDAENQRRYGSYEPVTATIAAVMSERAGIGWTSFSHTAVPVPVFALGAKSELFAGGYDNTDIAKKLAAAMRLAADMPVRKQTDLIKKNQSPPQVTQR